MNNKAVFVKNQAQIKIIKENGRLLATILDILKGMVKEGVNSVDLEREFIKLCDKNEARPACKGYAPYNMPPFPTGLCISVNNESVHCFPKKSKIFKGGDIVTIDTVIEKNSMFVDAAVSLVVEPSSSKEKDTDEYKKRQKIDISTIMVMNT